MSTVTDFPVTPRINIPRINKTAVKRRVYANDNDKTAPSATPATVHSLHEARTNAQVAKLRGSAERVVRLFPDTTSKLNSRKTHTELIERHRSLSTDALDVDVTDAAARLTTAMRVYLHGAGPHALAHLLYMSFEETMHDIEGGVA